MNVNHLYIHSSCFLPPKLFAQTFKVGHDFVQHMKETCSKLTGSENSTDVDGVNMLQVFLHRKLQK